MDLRWSFLDVSHAKRKNISFPDVYHSAQYGAAVQISDSAVWEIAICTFLDESKVYYCYLKRPIRTTGSASNLFDLVSPYGYCGPWAEGDVTEEGWKQFRRDFVEQASQRGYIAEFIRLSPMLNREQSMFRSISEGLTVWSHQKTIAIDISSGVATYMQRAKKKHRKAVKKAQDKGYTTAVNQATQDNLEDFIKIYTHTMKRTGAKEYYFFSRSYFTTLAAELQENLQLVTIKLRNRLAAACLYIRWGDMWHYHLGGSYSDFLSDGVNNLAHHAAACWAAENCIKIQHLGGGIQEGDSLFMFKQSIGDLCIPWFLASSVIDRSTYDKLSEVHARETGQTLEALEKSGFFPLYRS